MTRALGALPAPPLALAGGSLIFAIFVVALFLAVVFGYYTLRGSGISQRPYRRPDAPPEAPSELSHDMLQNVRNWERGTAGHHRQRPAPNRMPLDPGVAEALAEWRRAAAGPARLDPPVGPEDHVYGQGPDKTVAVYLDLASEPCRYGWRLLAQLTTQEPIRVAVRHLPLADVHPLALPAAEALEAAGAQGRFFELLDRLAAAGFSREEELLELAAAAVDDPQRLRAEVADGRYRATIVEHIRHATASGAHAIPELYIDGAHYGGVLARDVLSRALA
jgi:hypothetical protein